MTKKDSSSMSRPHPHQHLSKRKRIAAILSSVTSSSKQTTHSSLSCNPIPAQSASILGAMAQSARNSSSAISDALLSPTPEQPKKDHFDDKKYAYESSLHARRRLAAIANQLGLVTSTAKQAPSIYNTAATAVAKQTAATPSNDSSSPSPHTSKD